MGSWFPILVPNIGPASWPTCLGCLDCRPAYFVSVKPSPFLMVLEPQITSIVNFDECVEAYHMAQSDKLDYQMLH